MWLLLLLVVNILLVQLSFKLLSMNVVICVDGVGSVHYRVARDGSSRSHMGGKPLGHKLVGDMRRGLLRAVYIMILVVFHRC